MFSDFFGTWWPIVFPVIYSVARLLAHILPKHTMAYKVVAWILGQTPPPEMR